MKQNLHFNPITELISTQIRECKKSICIAVPFISNFAKQVLQEEIIKTISDKKILTCIDENNINSFELETLKYLINQGFEIRYNNEIHLKLYLLDSNGFTGSSNLTQSGFENKIEMMVKIDEENIKECRTFFEQIWENSKNNVVDIELIKNNYSKSHPSKTF